MRELLAQADLGDGATFNHIRELLDVSEDEMQERTKILLEYVRAIENNAFAKPGARVIVPWLHQELPPLFGGQGLPALCRGIFRESEAVAADESSLTETLIVDAGSEGLRIDAFLGLGWPA